MRNVTIFVLLILLLGVPGWADNGFKEGQRKSGRVSRKVPRRSAETSRK